VLPTAFIGGIAQSVAFSLTGAYLVWVSTTLSNAKGDTSSQYLSMAFGIYYMSVSFAPSIGGICSTFILSSNIGERVFQQHNTTENIEQAFLSNETINNITLICGPNFCPYQKAEVSQLEITNIVRFSLLGFYSLCMVASTLVFSFGMEERTSKKQEKQEKQKYSMSEVLRSTIHVIKQKRFLIVAPLIFYNGFQWAFVVGDIMKVSLVNERVLLVGKRVLLIGKRVLLLIGKRVLLIDKRVLLIGKRV
jgi:Na+/melibiose symporter-like transporter